MKFLDYIFKNLDVDHFIKNLKKNPNDSNSDFVKLILKSVWDINSLKNRILAEYVSEGTYYSINDIFHEKKINDTSKVYIGYIKKYKKNLSDKNILSYFKKTEIRNTWSNYKYDQSNPLKDLKEEERLDFNFILQQYFIDTVFFQKIKSFQVIGLYGPKDPSDVGKDWEMFAVYYKPEKTSIIFKVYYNDQPNDDYSCVFQKGLIKKKEILNDIGDYPDRDYFKEYKLYLYKEIDSYWTKGRFKKLFNLKINTKYNPINIKTYSKEDYLKKYKKDASVSVQFLINNPEMYLKSSPSTLKDTNLLSKIICYEWDKKPKDPLTKQKLFHYLITKEKSFRKNKKFISSIMYNCNDIEELKKNFDNSVLKDETISSELQVLGLFRKRSKSFIKKVLNKNKDKLNDLVGNYIPKYLLNDPDIMMEILKLDLDCMIHVGDKLNKNESFMRKVKKLVKS